jgi:DNA end-binding protein Ku
MVEIASEIIAQKLGKFEPAKFKDPYEAALVAMLKRRAKGARPVHEAEEEEAPSNVVNLMDALKKSLGRRRDSSHKEETSAGEPKVVPFRKKPRTKTKASPKPSNRAGGR